MNDSRTADFPNDFHGGDDCEEPEEKNEVLFAQLQENK
jgi:hypothetical protein